MAKKPRNVIFHLYRLQQKLAITNREAHALTVLLFFIVLGTLISIYQSSRPAVSPGFYATTDSLFLAATKEMQQHTASDTVQADTPATAPLTSQFFKPTFPININTATAAELELLPRIGPRMATRIITFRQTHGGFRTKAELKQIKGIGEKTYAGLENKITIE
ncbi:MAG: helix-hairpin-helix domain-containing protein [Bacteroidota bacterium]